MSQHSHVSAPDDAHSGPIKSPKQMLTASVLGFVLPVCVIIGLVAYVTSGNKPGAGAADSDMALAKRIQKVGLVEIRDANRPVRSGEEVFKAQCATCHGTGAMGSPKFQDAAAWAPRIATGFEALLNSALKGKNAMPPQSGGDLSDLEIARGVVYMANAGGAKFPEPKAPAGEGAAAGGGASAGKALYESTCVACHGSGAAGAPKFGDKAAWAPRVAGGLDALVASGIKGKNAMPAKGGSTASDADFRAAVEYLVNAAK